MVNFFCHLDSWTDSLCSSWLFFAYRSRVPFSCSAAFSWSFPDLSPMSMSFVEFSQSFISGCSRFLANPCKKRRRNKSILFSKEELKYETWKDANYVENKETRYHIRRGSDIKVNIFWEGKKNLQNLQRRFDWQYIRQI